MAARWQGVLCYTRGLRACNAREAGEVAEWSNAPDSKSGVRSIRTVGSNPTLSASNRRPDPVSSTSPVITLSPRDHDAVLFDLDGVLTDTARVHAAAWKRLFDEFLREHADAAGEAFVPFDIDDDYRRYVDGKPRLDGVTSFLESRSIVLPVGGPGDPPDAPTVQALAQRKDAYFLERLQTDGVDRYEASVELVETLRANDVKTAVVSSSRNCATVLKAAGIAHLQRPLRHTWSGTVVER